MTMTGLDVFDRTVHKTNSWLNELMELLGWHDKHKAYLALRVTLQALRDRLIVEEVAHSQRSFRCWSAASTTRAGIPQANQSKSGVKSRSSPGSRGISATTRVSIPSRSPARSSRCSNTGSRKERSRISSTYYRQSCGNCGYEFRSRYEATLS